MRVGKESVSLTASQIELDYFVFCFEGEGEQGSKDGPGRDGEQVWCGTLYEIPK